MVLGQFCKRAAFSPPSVNRIFVNPLSQCFLKLPGLLNLRYPLANGRKLKLQSGLSLDEFFVALPKASQGPDPVSFETQTQRTQTKANLKEGFRPDVSVLHDFLRAFLNQLLDGAYPRIVEE